MVEVTEVTDNGQQGKRSTINTSYRGPGDDFPFMAFNILGGTHILLATAMLITGVIHIALGEMDRLYFLLTGGVSFWCPMAALATGIIGAVISDRRHWEVYCLKQGFLAMSIITAFLFMVPLAVVTGMVDFCYYGLACVDVVTNFLGVQRGPEEAADDRVALVWVIIALACLEFLVCILSACICCCCSPLYQEAEPETQEQQIVIKQQSPPPIYVEKTPQPQPTVVVQKPAPRPQQPIIVQAPPQPKPAPIILQAPAPRPAPMPMIMAPPPPQPIYGALPAGPQPIYGPAPQPMYRSMRSVRRPVRTTIM